MDQVVADGDDLAPRPAARRRRRGRRRHRRRGLHRALDGLPPAARPTPALRVVVVERQVAGFGASGRNGGWCSALFPASEAALTRRHGRDAALAMGAAMRDTVDEVGKAVAAEGIACDWVKGGTVALARTAGAAAPGRGPRAGLRRPARRRGGGARRRHPRARRRRTRRDCARIQPARLVRGLARAVERRGGAHRRGAPRATAVGPAPGGDRPRRRHGGHGACAPPRRGRRSSRRARSCRCTR